MALNYYTQHPIGVWENAIESSFVADDLRPPYAATSASTWDETTWPGSSSDDQHTEVGEDLPAKVEEKAQATQAEHNEATHVIKDSDGGTPPSLGSCCRGRRLHRMAPTSSQHRAILQTFLASTASLQKEKGSRTTRVTTRTPTPVKRHRYNALLSRATSFGQKEQQI
jgi:hypothetical protein